MKSSKGDVAIHIAKAPQRPSKADIDFTLEMLAQAESGEVSAFAWCAVGPQFATWWDVTNLTRDQRMNLIGQLSMLIRLLQDTELASR